MKIKDVELGEIHLENGENEIRNLEKLQGKTGTEKFSDVMVEYDKLTKKIGIYGIDKIQKMIDDGDQSGLIRESKNIKDKGIREATLRLAKYV